MSRSSLYGEHTRRHTGNFGSLDDQEPGPLRAMHCQPEAKDRVTSHTRKISGRRDVSRPGMEECVNPSGGFRADNRVQRSIRH